MNRKLSTNFSLPYFSKIFEKVMFSYVIECLEDNNIIYEYQFGFRKKSFNKSCNHDPDRDSN